MLLFAEDELFTSQLVRIVYDTLADLAQELSEDQVDALYARVCEKPFAQYKVRRNLTTFER